MLKFIVSASLLTTAFAGYGSEMSGGQYGSGGSEGQQYGSGGSEMQQYGSGGSGGSEGQQYGGGQSGGYEQPPAQMTEAPASTPCTAEGAMKTHTVLVGGDSLTYSPESIYAKKGDWVWFKFLQKNHTVTQSTFDKPCKKMDGGEDSSFMASKATVMSQEGAPMWKYEVKDDTKPTWWYCKQKKGMHCGMGMVFAINPSAEKSFDMFKKMAMEQNGTMTGDGGAGGSYGQGGSGASYAPPPPAYTAPAEQAPPPPSYAPGQGEGGNGACSCSCFCGVQSWGSNYGVGGYSGGMPGMLPMPGSMESAPAEQAPPAQETAPPAYESAPPAQETAPPAQEGGSY